MSVRSSTQLADQHWSAGTLQSFYTPQSFELFEIVISGHRGRERTLDLRLGPPPRVPLRFTAPVSPDLGPFPMLHPE